MILCMYILYVCMIYESTVVIVILVKDTRLPRGSHLLLHCSTWLCGEMSSTVQNGLKHKTICSSCRRTYGVCIIAHVTFSVEKSGPCVFSKRLLWQVCSLFSNRLL